MVYEETVSIPKEEAGENIDTSPSLVKVYGYDFAKKITENMERITMADNDVICHASGHYKLWKLMDESSKSCIWILGRRTLTGCIPDKQSRWTCRKQR